MLICLAQNMGEANTGMDKNVRLALLGDHEAAKL